MATGPEVAIPVGTRVCWGAVLGSCATFFTAAASMLVPIPDGLSFEDAACLAVAGLTAAGLARVWPLKGRAAVVWGAAGAVGRLLVAALADHGVNVIGIASGKRVDAVRAAGANHASFAENEILQHSPPEPIRFRMEHLPFDIDVRDSAVN